MKTILITHQDLDGEGCFVLGEHFQTKLEIDYIMGENYDFDNNPELIEFIETFDRIIITDLSVSEETAKRWKEMGKLLHFFDHHGGTKWIENYGESKWDDTRCGTLIFWQEFIKPKVKRYPKIIDQFAELVDVYDCWRQENPLWGEAKNLNSVLYGIKNYNPSLSPYEQAEPFYKLMLKKFQKLPEWRWTKQELEIIERSNKREQEMYDRARDNLSIRMDSRGLWFGVCMIPSKISLVASRILEEEENLDYLILINSYGGVSGKISSRSRNGFVCPSLACIEGHDPAAATQLSPEKAIELFENKSLCFKYKEDYTEGDDPFVEVDLDEKAI